MKSEAEIWREERERIERKTARQRARTRWFSWQATLPEPPAHDPDMYRWFSVEELMEKSK